MLEFLETARERYNHYGGGDKVITKIKLLHKAKTGKNKSLYNQYEVTYKSRVRGRR